MNRTEFFNEHRPLYEDGRIPAEHVPVLDGIANKLGLARIEASPAHVSDIPDSYWSTLAQIESGNRPFIKAPTSSASGLYQFIKATWIGEGGKWGDNPAAAFGGLYPSEAEQTARAKSFTEKNAMVLRKAGVRINRATLYAAHFLGVGTAVKILAASDSARADTLAGAPATKANESILRGKTVVEFKAWLKRKTGDQA